MPTNELGQVVGGFGPPPKRRQSFADQFRGVGQPGGGMAQPAQPGQQRDFAAGQPAQPATPILQAPSEREGFYSAADYKTPGFGESATQDLFNQNLGQAGAANTANQYFQQFQGQIGQDPGLGAYYDRAKTRLGSDMNQQLAARGAYGSSVGAGMVGDALAGLEAERANREADYMLRQQGLGGELAGQAARSQLGWTQGLGGMGLAGDAAARDRLGLGLTGATAADAGLLDRRGMMFNELYGLTGMATGNLGGAQQAALQSDQALFESAMAAKYGLGTEMYNQALEDSAAQQQQIGTVGSIAGSIIGGVTGGGGGMGGI